MISQDIQHTEEPVQALAAAQKNTGQCLNSVTESSSVAVATKRNVHLLMYIGVEGTGHHPMQSLTKLLADTVFNPQTANTLFRIMFKRFTKGMPNDVHVNKGLVEASIANAAIEMDLVIDKYENSTTFAFADWSNPFSHKIFSGVDPLDLLDLSNQSRHNVRLSLIVINRNFTQIIWSTALRRKFDSVTAKVNEIYNAATVIDAQLAHVPLCNWRSFDFTDYKRHPHEYRQGFAKHFRKSMPVVEAAFEKVMPTPDPNKTVVIKPSKYDTLWTSEDLEYTRDTFERPLVVNLWERLAHPRYSLLSSFDKVGCDCSE